MKRYGKLKRREVEIIITDLLMMWLLLINLGLIIFDWIFSSPAVQELLLTYTAGFFHFYNDNIHQDFLVIDLYFVAIFLIEILIRWVVAAVQRTYHRWYYYPFVHWYDVLGCIPVGSMRFLRILRVISILIRLHKLEIIDLTKSYLFQVGRRYYDIIVEEISDRVVVKVIDGVQAEVKDGGPMLDRILNEAVEPQKEILVEWLSQQTQRVAQRAQGMYQADYKNYIDTLVKEAIANNKEVGMFDSVPVFGGLIVRNLERAISDIVFNVINSAIKDLASENNKVLMNDLADITFDALGTPARDGALDKVSKEIVLKSLEIIKDQVKIQQWKLKEQDAQQLDSSALEEKD